MTHNIPLMLIVNCLIALFISYISTRYLVKPLNDIIQNIVSLSKGHYLKPNQKPSLYREVEDRITDLSQQLQVTQYERQQMDTVREEWIANISHDIKTPLTSIRGNAEIMADMSYEMDLISRQKSAQTIIEKSDYIKNLVDDLNLSTRLKNKEFILNKKQVNLVSLLRHVIIEIMNDPKYENYNIQFSYDNEYIPLMLDELLMRRVFTNLMMNAITHNEESVLISIDIKDHTITLKDNGVGVCEEDLLHIFKRYYRGTNTKKPNVGSGLGLAIAYDIVKLHEGIISASSTRGNGLTITITL
ncbi:sensor histidine kinase [Turicibacter sp. HGF1]|uniref:sensor histidine kinase n=1 Tax=Turicibacter sp. HGF1 TaxID=910310 RepID=UPI001585AFC3|nr:HAMP domain-containing sensor histidine kinase [Turicibacter sp. HGF1]